MQYSTNTSAPTVLPVTYEQYKQQQTQRATGSSEMNQMDFLNLLIVQMQNQDPLSPMENSEFTSQTTAFSQLEQLTKLNSSMESMLNLQQSQYQTNQNLVNSSSFIGKYIEYDTNTLMVDGLSVTPIKFYASEAGTKGTAYIYNKNEELVGVVELEGGISKGSNAFAWNGKGIGGVELEDGNYYFEIYAYKADNTEVSVATYGEGQVTGIKVDGGTMYFDIGGGLVPASAVYGVKDEASLR